jgi:hypothetical protein
MRSNTEQKNGAIKRAVIVLAIASLVTLLVMVAPLSAAMDKGSNGHGGADDHGSNGHGGADDHGNGHGGADDHGNGHGGGPGPAPCVDSCVQKTDISTNTYTTTTHMRNGYCIVVKTKCTTTHTYLVCDHKCKCSNNHFSESDGSASKKSDGGTYKTTCETPQWSIVKCGFNDKHDNDKKGDKHDNDKKGDKHNIKNMMNDKKDDKKDNNKKGDNNKIKNMMNDKKNDNKNEKKNDNKNEKKNDNKNDNKKGGK